MAVEQLNAVGAVPLEHQFHAAQLPVGDVAQVFQGGVTYVVLVHQGKGGDGFIAHADLVLLVTGQTGGGLQVGQLGGVHLLLHIADEFLLALVGGVLGAGGFIQGAPVRVGKQLVKYLLCLCGGLAGFKILQPSVEPVHTEIGADKEHQDEHEIQGVEDYAAGAGPLFLLLGRRSGRPPGGGRLGAGSGRRLGGPGRNRGGFPGNRLPGSSRRFLGNRLCRGSFGRQVPSGGGFCGPGGDHVRVPLRCHGCLLFGFLCLFFRSGGALRQQLLNIGGFALLVEFSLVHGLPPYSAGLTSQ